MKVFGIIPARGGSKAIPNKNLVPLLNKPLLSYTCEAAHQSCRLSRIILSTDNEEIAEVGRSCGIDVPFLRPPELAQDETPMLDVLRHALAWAREEGDEPCAVVLLQPTSPLRRAEHIDGAIDLFLSSQADTVVSVVQVPHQYGPASLLQIDSNGQLYPYMDQPIVLRRQEKPKYYARNGPAVLVIKPQVLEAGQLYGNIVRPFEMECADSVDIDVKDDVALAEFWLLRRRGHHS